MLTMVILIIIRQRHQSGPRNGFESAQACHGSDIIDPVLGMALYNIVFVTVHLRPVEENSGIFQVVLLQVEFPDQNTRLQFLLGCQPSVFISIDKGFECATCRLFLHYFIPRILVQAAHHVKQFCGDILMVEETDGRAQQRQIIPRKYGIRSSKFLIPSTNAVFDVG